ncbi:secreted protein [Melampsora americana]|nr:secreted protein [Melampsora americana]
MLNLQRFVILALGMIFTIVNAELEIQCQNVTKMINPKACLQALDLLKPYEKDGKILRDESGFQLTCDTCKVDIVTMNESKLNIDAATVQTQLNDLLNKCPGDAASVIIPNGSDFNKNSDQDSTKLSITYPVVVPDSCSMF